MMQTHKSIPVFKLLIGLFLFAAVTAFASLAHRRRSAALRAGFFSEDSSDGKQQS